MTESTLGRWAVLGAAGFAAGIAWIGPGRLDILPPCLFHEWTGLLCPGCGSTRALSALLRGDPVSAIGLNPLAVAFMLTLPGLLLVRRSGYRPHPSLVWSGIGLLGLFWIARNLPLPAFEVLRP